MRYPVAEIFRSIQGEGHFVGYPMVFIRLAGCSVTNCHIRRECDEAPWKATEVLTEMEIAKRAWDLFPGGIACITGGEPTSHDLYPLVDSLKAMMLRVHLETSGVNAIVGHPYEWITVSPKTRDYAQRLGHTLKIVVRPEWSAADVLELDKGTTFFHRYLQPMTSIDGTNIDQVMAMIADRNLNAGGRWALSTQAHKTWGVK